MIYYFGDSHTAGVGSLGSPNPKLWNHIPYSKYLTDLLKIESKNLAQPGRNFVLNVIDLISNLSDIEKNASIVIFQTQFLCNSVLKYDDVNFYTKDIVITSGNLSKDMIYENQEYDITKDDSITLLNWSSKFEERRSLYELDIVFAVFQYLKSKGIRCYVLYWAAPFNVKFPDNEFVIKYNKEKYAINFIQPITTFYDISNGEWLDYHTTNDWNEKLAKIIFEKIVNKYI